MKFDAYMYLRALIRTSQFQFHSSIVCSWSRFLYTQVCPFPKIEQKRNVGVRYVYVVKTSRYLIDSHKDETNSISNICPLFFDPLPPHLPTPFYSFIYYFLGSFDLIGKDVSTRHPLSMLGSDNTRKRFLGWKRKLKMNIVWLKRGEQMEAKN